MVNEKDGLEVEGGPGVGLGGEVVVDVVRPPKVNGELEVAEGAKLEGPVKEKGGAEAVVMATLGTEIEEA